VTDAPALDLAFDLSSPRARADPHTVLRRMRTLDPVHRRVEPSSGLAFWYLTRYADVQAALLDPAIGREHERLPAPLAAAHRKRTVDPLFMVRRNVFNLDPPDHTRLRRLIAPAFGARATAAADRAVAAAVDGLLADLAAASGPVDVVSALALPLPTLVVAGLIGFPADDLGLLRRWSDEMARSRDAARARAAGLEFLAYAADRIEERRARPGEDLLSRLIAAQEAGELTRHELMSSVFQLLLAGDETTVNLIGNMVLELLRHPAQLARLRAEPELIGSAVEEAARYNGAVGHARPLHALAEVSCGGRRIPAGDTVIPVLLAANRDPAAFPDPDVFDIARSPNRHLGFGHGIHFCLGAALARMQVRAAVGGLVRRFGRIELALGEDELAWTPDLFLHGVLRLPVLLDA
jgi:cytochrome P450